MNRDTLRETLAEAEAAAATPPGESFVREAETLLKIAKILEPFTPEVGARIMSSVCAQLGRYDDAEKFIGFARAHAAKARRDAEARGEGEPPAWEAPPDVPLRGVKERAR